MVKIEAQANILGMRAGQTAVVELTPLIQTHVDQRWLKIIDQSQTDTPTPGADSVPEVVDTPKDGPVDVPENPGD